jgi:hypothetical protein
MLVESIGENPSVPGVEEVGPWEAGGGLTLLAGAGGLSLLMEGEGEGERIVEEEHSVQYHSIQEELQVQVERPLLVEGIQHHIQEQSNQHMGQQLVGRQELELVAKEERFQMKARCMRRFDFGRHNNHHRDCHFLDDL